MLWKVNPTLVTSTSPHYSPHIIKTRDYTFIINKPNQYLAKMWIVTKIADLVQLKPQDFYKTSLEAIEDKINEKYANKVIPNIGLCVCVWDITDASEGLIGQYDGFVNINVEFHMVVFRPHRGEVIQARIKEQTSQGMRRELYLLFLFVAASS